MFVGCFKHFDLLKFQHESYHVYSENDYLLLFEKMDTKSDLIAHKCFLFASNVHFFILPLFLSSCILLRLSSDFDNINPSFHVFYFICLHHFDGLIASIALYPTLILFTIYIYPLVTLPSFKKGIDLFYLVSQGDGLRVLCGIFLFSSRLLPRF